MAGAPLLFGLFLLDFNLLTMLLQTINGAISGDYTIIVLVACIGALLLLIFTIVGHYFVSTVKKIDRRQDRHEEELREARDEHQDLRLQVVEMKSSIPDPDSFANAMIQKLRLAGELRKL